MRVAILGAGLCGLATAWHLAKSRQHQVVLFDPLGIGKGTSGIAAGLLHPYAGARSPKNWRADEGLAATLALIKVAEAAFGTSVITHTGLQRSALSQQQQADFLHCSKEHADVKWRSVKECQDAVSGVSAHPGIFIENAYVVDCAKYLEGLWLACEALGVQFEQKAVRSLAELDAFDHVVVAMGAASNSLPELAHIKITPIKGQILTLEWPEDVPSPPYPISSQAYLLKNDNTCIVGATYERHFTSEQADEEYARSDILPKLHACFPALKTAKVVGCRAGVRASTARHRPLIVNVGKGRWVLTGMGSKGLLYHALFAKEIVDALQ